MNQDKLEAFKAMRPRLVYRLTSIWESFKPKKAHLDSIIKSAYDMGVDSNTSHKTKIRLVGKNSTYYNFNSKK